MVNIAIFVSGKGTNCENLIRYFSNGDKVKVSLVLATTPGAEAIGKAKALGVSTSCLSRGDFNNDGLVMAIMKDNKIDFIILAGFIQLIPSFLVRAYEGRMINIHPALLPKYGGKGMYGRHVHEAVKAAGERQTGMTVHWVSDKYDEGTVIAQYKVAISEEDTVEDIIQEEHELEMRYFPVVVEKVLESIV